MNNLYAFMMFASVACITPGPSNILILSNANNFGFFKTLPFVFGCALGAASLVLMSSFGAVQLIQTVPLLKPMLNWAGTLWLTYLAYQLARSAISKNTDMRSSSSLSLIKGVGLQFINPKPWMMAIAVGSIYSDVESGFKSVALLAGIFFVIAVLGSGIWALAGSKSRQWMNQGIEKNNGSTSKIKKQKTINLLLTAFLLISVWWPIFSG